MIIFLIIPFFPPKFQKWKVNPVNPLGLGPWPECTTLLYELTGTLITQRNRYSFYLAILFCSNINEVGVSEDAVAEQIQIVSDIAKKNGGTDLYIAKRLVYAAIIL